jgi:hypothetical protein
LFYVGGFVGFDKRGCWVASYFIKARSLYSAKGRGVGVSFVYAFISRFASGRSLASPFSELLLLALRHFLPLIQYGNDLHIPSLFGKGRVYIVPKGYFCILELE